MNLDEVRMTKNSGDAGKRNEDIYSSNGYFGQGRTLSNILPAYPGGRKPRAN